MSLLSLPPELLLQIFHHVIPSPLLDLRQVTPLTLVHPSLTSLAHQLVFVDLVLRSDRQVERLVASQSFHDHAHLVTRLRFDATDGTGIGTGGIGTEPQICGRLARQVLSAIDRSTQGLGRLRELDVNDCAGLESSALCGKSLGNLQKLTIGPGIVFSERANPLFPPGSELFHFKLTDSLTVTNNHWQSLPTSFCSSLFSQTCRGSLRTLNLAGLYSVERLSPLLDSSLDLFASVENLYLPPFETLSQIIFSTLLVDESTSTSTLTAAKNPSNGVGLRYLELPSLSDPRSNVLLLPFLESVTRNRSRIVEIGFKNPASQALSDSILIVLHSLYGGPPGSTFDDEDDDVDRVAKKGDKGPCRVERIRMVKLRGTAQVSETMDREGELIVDLIGQFGCDVEYGEYTPEW